MIHLFVGTKAQFIKLAPVIAEMRDRGIPYRHVDSGQHGEITRSLKDVFGMAEPDVSLRIDKSDIVTIRHAIGWYLKHLSQCLFNRSRLRKQIFPGGGICLIHGDTLSTLLGLQMAKAAGLKVAHVEAGLRSHNIWEPFPEELIRIYCMKRSDVLFAPSDEAFANLEKMKLKGEVVKAMGNTVADSLRLVDSSVVQSEIPSEPYALATCHRLETISKKSRLKKVVDLLNQTAEKWKTVFVTHKPTQRYLAKFDLTESLDPRIECRGMLDYATFVALQKNATLVLTDGGSIQEECGYLRKPCLILRKVSERSDGIGSTARIWGFEDDVAQDFFTWVESYEPTSNHFEVHPSKVIVEKLCELGYADSETDSI